MQMDVYSGLQRLLQTSSDNKMMPVSDVYLNTVTNSAGSVQWIGGCCSDTEPMHVVLQLTPDVVRLVCCRPREGAMCGWHNNVSRPYGGVASLLCIYLAYDNINAAATASLDCHIINQLTVD
jgi:hypothetical protein